MSCDIRFSQDEKKAWLGQPHFCQSLEKQIGEQVMGMQSHKTPVMPMFLIIRLNGSDKITVEDQKFFKSRIRILYIVKHSKPDSANATWELSKVMDGANPATLLEMDCMIKYALYIKNLKLMIEPNENKK